MADGGQTLAPQQWRLKWLLPEPQRKEKRVAGERQHSVMSLYVRGLGWVDIRPWKPRCPTN